MRTLTTGPGDLWVGTGRAFRDAPLAGTLIVWQAYGQAQPWVLLTDTPVAQTEPTLHACRNWIEQGFRGLKTVGWKWHKTRRRDPVRVGRHWLVLAIATLLAVAYGTRREEAEARHLPPGRLRRPPAELDAAQQAALPPLCCSSCCCAAICGPACGCGRRPAPTSARAWASGPRRHLNSRLPARDPHRTALSTPRPPRSSHHAAARQAILPLWSRPDRTLPLTVAPAMPGPVTRGAGPPLRRLHRFPLRKYPCEPGFPPAGRGRRAPLGRGPGLSPGLRLGTGARPAVVTPLITRTGSVATSDPYDVEIHLLLTGAE